MGFIVEGDTDFASFSLDKTVGLTAHVKEKDLSNGDVFTGEVDAVTGDMGHEVYVHKDLNAHKGPFASGLRHGGGAVCTKLDELKNIKFAGSFQQDCLLKGTLTKEWKYTGEFGGGGFDNPIFHGEMECSQSLTRQGT
jgi:hypothetical protein